MANVSIFRNAMEAVSHIADPTAPWDDVLLTAKAMIGADAATLLMFNERQDLLVLRQTGIDESAEREYTDYYYQYDSLAQAALQSPSGRWWDSVTLQATSEIRRLPFYADYMPRHRMGQVLAYVITGDPERRAAVSFQRMSATSDAVEKISQGRTAVYLRALTQAIANRERAGALQFNSLEMILTGLGDAAFLAGATGILYRCSARAYELLAKANMLSTYDRAVTHPRAEFGTAFRQALAKAAHQQQKIKFALPTNWGEGIRFDIVPAADALKLANEPILLVRMQACSVFSVPDVAQIKSFFSVTEAEARVLCALIQGHSPLEYAQLAGLAERTVRNHIASLMKKMCCSRQAELVRLGSLLS
ncbi:helix-turn-helix transcriptional regulator [Paraburkholderia sp.]|uniref:helix-turn-helix transcriptional regulator n=1 Tax=Paraburkholderia sp. TaxID=1926495 RepID=UPI003C7E8480